LSLVINPQTAHLPVLDAARIDFCLCSGLEYSGFMWRVEGATHSLTTSIQIIVLVILLLSFCSQSNDTYKAPPSEGRKENARKLPVQNKYEFNKKKNACIYLMWLHILNQNWYWKHALQRQERDINT